MEKIAVLSTLTGLFDQLKRIVSPAKTDRQREFVGDRARAALRNQYSRESAALDMVQRGLPFGSITDPVGADAVRRSAAIASAGLKVEKSSMPAYTSLTTGVGAEMVKTPWDSALIVRPAMAFAVRAVEGSGKVVIRAGFRWRPGTPVDQVVPFVEGPYTMQVTLPVDPSKPEDPLRLPLVEGVYDLEDGPQRDLSVYHVDADAMLVAFMEQWKPDILVEVAVIEDGKLCVRDETVPFPPGWCHPPLM